LCVSSVILLEKSDLFLQILLGQSCYSCITYWALFFRKSTSYNLGHRPPYILEVFL